MKPPTIVFVWDNFGPMHVERLEAVASRLENAATIVGLELLGRSDTYNWDPTVSTAFQKITLFQDGYPRRWRTFRATKALVRAIINLRASHIFLCHYELPMILLTAIVLRLLGRQVYVMNNSKFDDKERFVLREVVKSLFVIPYTGALTAGQRSKSYLVFLGIPDSKIQLGYNTMSIARVRNQSNSTPAPGGEPFDGRHFSIVARFVPKKNLSLALEAYAHYVKLVARPRALHVAGYGPLEPQLRDMVVQHNLTKHVVFVGALNTAEVSKLFSTTLVLLLPSREEQFGNVISEAQAMGLPAIISDACGGWDVLVDSYINGFVIESDNSEGLAYFMMLLSEDESLWRRMAAAAVESAKNADAERFAEGVVPFLEGNGRAHCAEEVFNPTK